MSAILIADDNDDLQGMWRQLLESHVYRVLEAAVRERPALVIMDLGMPGMDGLSAVAEIRRHVPATETEILIVSAYDQLEYRTEAVALGCGGFMTKPVDPAALMTAIRLLLREEGESATLP